MTVITIASSSDEEVDVTDAAARFGTLEAARLIFEASARAQQPVLTSVRSRELISAAAQLSSAEADILFLRARQAGGRACAASHPLRTTWGPGAWRRST